MMLNLFTIGMTKIKSSAAVLLLPLCVLLSGNGAELIITVVALIMHEIAHTLMLKALGYSIDCLELQPFGFIARLSSSYDNSLDELIVAATGPIASMVLGLTAIAIAASNEGAVYAKLFGNISVTIGIMNLLPAYPLDGGKLLLCILEILIGARKAKRITIYIGIFIAFVFSALTIYLICIDMRALPYAVMFALLLLAALREKKSLEITNARKLALKQSRFRRGSIMRIQQVAINENSTVSQAIKLLDGGRYTIFTVLDSNMNIVKTISESELMSLDSQKPTLKT